MFILFHVCMEKASVFPKSCWLAEMTSKLFGRLGFMLEREEFSLTLTLRKQPPWGLSWMLRFLYSGQVAISMFLCSSPNSAQTSTFPSLLSAPWSSVSECPGQSCSGHAEPTPHSDFRGPLRTAPLTPCSAGPSHFGRPDL